MAHLKIHEVPNCIQFSTDGWFGLALKPPEMGSAEADIGASCDAIRDWGAAAVLSVCEPGSERSAYRLEQFARGVRERHMTWYHLPIRKGELPSPQFEEAWVKVGEELRTLLRNGFRIVALGDGDPDAASMVIARACREMGGCDVEQLIYRLQHIQKDLLASADLQAHVRALPRKVPSPVPETTPAAIRDRALGALLGLAVGDALGTTLEFKPRDSYPLLTDMVGGGPFGLDSGQWTDDTAMALALADTLQEQDFLDDWPKKDRLIREAEVRLARERGRSNMPLMEAIKQIESGDYPGNRRRFERALLGRFVAWKEQGEFSCTGHCFDIGATVSDALAYWEYSCDPIAGSPDRKKAGNGSLMRLAPIAIKYWNDRRRLRDYAARQSHTTHGAREAVDACVAFAELLADAIEGKAPQEVLQPHKVALPGEERGYSRAPLYAEMIERILMGSWRDKPRSDVRASGYVLHSLEAALWSVGRTGNFADAVLTAANLGEDADTTAAITGQLAGGLYGASAIPAAWREKLAWHDRMVDYADALLPEVKPRAR
jgi:ADP-ribosyl-[dinitrogen reductase] hydrolase